MRIKTPRLLLSLLLIVFGVYIFTVLIPTRAYSVVDREAKLLEINKQIKKQESGKICKRPILPLNSSEISKFFKVIPQLVCKKGYPDWVIVHGSYCIINEEAKRKFGEIYCDFTDIIRQDDQSYINGKTTRTKSQYQLTVTDVVKVYCKANSGASWNAALTGIRYDTKLRSQRITTSSSNILPINILMFGFDSISHNTFIRKLPKTYQYLTDVLGAQVLNGYNIVGDGTPQALIPILTGKNELELPDTRKRISGTAFVDVYPFIWYDFAKLGYITGYLEDTPSVGTFTYRLRGFQKQPTTHYMRAYFVTAEKYKPPSDPFCYGAQKTHNIMLNYIENFFKEYKRQPKFMFGFHAELSHDSYNLVGVADDDVKEWLQRLSTSGALNNTMLIFMADHGHRFGAIRNTIQGKQEERLPFFSFTLPKWFRDKYPQAYKNLQTNVDRLTTPYDIHATFKHLFNWGIFEKGNLDERSISLFNEIPEERSCADAYIEPHWCACLEWFPLPNDSKIASTVADVLVNKLNQLTSHIRNLCHQLQRKAILWISQMTPNDKMLKFSKNLDNDGYLGTFTSHKKSLPYRMYQIKIETSPNNGLYEASVKQYGNGTLIINTRDISRINMYGSQPHCIMNLYPDLRKYCYCIKS